MSLSLSLLFTSACLVDLPVQNDAGHDSATLFDASAGDALRIDTRPADAADTDIPPISDAALADNGGADTGNSPDRFLIDAGPQDHFSAGDLGLGDHNLSDTGIHDTGPNDTAPGENIGLDAGLADHTVEDARPDCDAADPICRVQDLYPGTLGLRDEALLDRLEAILIQTHTSPVKYDDNHPNSKDHLYGRQGGVGLDAVDGGIYCIYTGQVLSDDYNCEHSWPRSDFDERAPMLGDLHHLFAVDAIANNRRSNLHFAEVQGDAPGDWDWPDTCPCDDDNLKSCCSVLGDGVDERVSKAFEPRDAAKGNIARALFYFAVRYRNRDINLSRPTDTGPEPANRIPAYEEEALRRWNLSDPVSERERLRMQRIQALQGNRNPCIDCPEFVNKISDF